MSCLTPLVLAAPMCEEREESEEMKMELNQQILALQAGT